MDERKPRAWHCIERAKERYGLNLTTADVRDMENQIVGGTSVMTRGRGTGNEEHLVRLGDRVLRVIWRTDGAVIVTVMPKGAGVWKRSKKGKK